MEAQERHSPEPILEETFLPQPSNLQLGSLPHSHHSHLDPDDTSPSSLLHELTPEQTDLLKVQLQLHSYQQQRLHLHQHLHHHQHQHPFSLDDDDDDEQHSRSPLEHHHHHHDNVLQIHSEDTGISSQDLASTSGLHHLDFGHSVEFSDGQGLQIPSHQPIYEDPTGGPYHLSQSFDLSSSSLSFEHTELAGDVHPHQQHSSYSSHSNHHLSIQPVASSSTSSLEETQPSEPTKRKVGRPGRKKSGAVPFDQLLNGSSEGTGIGTPINNSAGAGAITGTGAKNTKPVGGSTTGPGPTKRLRTVASLGDDMEKIEKLRAQGRERQRRKRERDRARAAGISLDPENPALRSVSGQNLNPEPGPTLSLYHPVQSASRSSTPSDSTSVPLLTSQHNQPTLLSNLPSIDPSPIFRPDDHNDQRQTRNELLSIRQCTSPSPHSTPSHLPADMDARAHAPAQVHADKILDDQGILQRLDDLSRSRMQTLKERIYTGNNRADLVDIRQCLEAGEHNKSGERFTESIAPVQEADTFDGDNHLSVRSNLAHADSKTLDRCDPVEEDDVEGESRSREDGRSEQSPEIDSTLALDEWDISIDLDLDHHLSPSPSHPDPYTNGNLHSHSVESRDQNRSETQDNPGAHHDSLEVKRTVIIEAQDGLHVDGLNAQDGEHPEGLLEMTHSLSIPLLPYFCSG